MNTEKIDRLITRYAEVIERTKTQLATNFDIPARDLISMACNEMHCDRKDWNAIIDRIAEN